MARAPQDSDSSGVVVELALEIAGNVWADEETAGMEKKTLTARKGLQTAMTERNDARDEVILAGAVARAAQSKTGRVLKLVGKKVAGELQTERQSGEKHKVFVRLFDKKTPATYLPGDAEDRKQALVDFEDEVADKETPPAIRKLCAPALEAFAGERRALAQKKKADAALAKAQEKEETQKGKVVTSVRALVAAVQGKFADEPARAREVLGYGTPNQSKKKAPDVAPGAAGGPAPKPVEA